MDKTALELAWKVADAMGPGWAASEHPHGFDGSASLINIAGDSVQMTILDQAAMSPPAGDRGKVRFRGARHRDLADHYGYKFEMPSTLVTAERGPEAMAKAVLRKIVPILEEANRAARVRAIQHHAQAARVHGLAVSLCAAAGDTRGVERLATERVEDWSTQYRRIGPVGVDLDVYDGRADVAVRDVPPEMAARWLREFKAHQDAEKDPA